MPQSEVYTCVNKDCQRYLYNGKALLEVIIEEKIYSINPSQNFFEYAYENETVKIALKEAFCPHCKSKASTTTLQFDLEVDKEKLIKDLDDLDSLIFDMLKQCESQAKQ